MAKESCIFPLGDDTVCAQRFIVAVATQSAAKSVKSLLIYLGFMISYSMEHKDKTCISNGQIVKFKSKESWKLKIGNGKWKMENCGAPLWARVTKKIPMNRRDRRDRRDRSPCLFCLSYFSLSFLFSLFFLSFLSSAPRPQSVVGRQKKERLLCGSRSKSYYSTS